LEVEASKTKLIPFGRFAEKEARGRGGKPEQFDFLGFTHYCGRTRQGSFKVKRRTSKKKFRAKLKETSAWLKAQRSVLRKGMLLRAAKLRLQGHLNYYAITDNGPMCDAFRSQVQWLLFRWLNRQSQRRSYSWERFMDALLWVGWPSVRIVHNLDPFRRVGLNDCLRAVCWKTTCTVPRGAGRRKHPAYSNQGEASAEPWEAGSLSISNPARFVTGG